MQINAFVLAQRFVGLAEVAGRVANPQILAMLRLDQKWPIDDSVPWCSAFVNFVCWLLRLPRSKSLRARSWLSVGRPIPLEWAQAGFDVVILKRGLSDAGPDVQDAPGHVGFFAGQDNEHVLLLGGNQSDSVSIASFPRSRVLGVRRLYEELAA